MTATTNTTTDPVTLRIKKIMVDKLGLHESQLTDSAGFVYDLGVDSLDVMELQIELEKEFDITIPTEKAEKLATVGALIHYIKKATP